MSNDHVLKPTELSVSEAKRRQLNSRNRLDPDVDDSKVSPISPQESREYHFRSDVDVSRQSQHHTLGTNRTQASPGDHNHDGSTSRKIGPLEMDPSNPGRTRAEWTIPVGATTADIVAFLHNFVEFREV